ncbi:hypothetical protein [Acinetobacter bereziniae]|uniref:hypothetical protein n=1 Tax=Acinetobacter bereziniae TaxID=106648 RepID=UPI003AF71310
MIVPDSTQVPLCEPIYSNGVMSQVWVMFFQKLAKLANNSDANGDILELIQLVHQLPNNAQQAQLGFDLNDIQHSFDSIPIFTQQSEEMPPIQAVFLCSEQPLPLSHVTNLSRHNLPFVALPSSEIIHDQV